MVIVLYFCKYMVKALKHIFDSIVGRTASCLLYLALSAQAVSAQEVYGTPLGGLHRSGVPSAYRLAPQPGYLRDSLSFMMHVKHIVPPADMLSSWPAADSMAVEAVAARNVSLLSPAQAAPLFTRSPYAFDFSTGGVITSWRSGAVVGSAFRTTMPALMSRQNASVGVVQNVGNLTITGNVSADRYLLWRGNRTAYTFSGAATYRFNDNWSATVFGRYSSNRSFYSMAAMPYMGTSGYGGFVTFMGETVGMDLGVERYYDTFAGRWVTSPIITPKVRVAEKFTIELPVGWMVKELIDNAVHNRKRRGGAMIMPEGVPSIGEVPFGTPEMPK